MTDKTLLCRIRFDKSFFLQGATIQNLTKNKLIFININFNNKLFPFVVTIMSKICRTCVDSCWLVQFLSKHFQYCHNLVDFIQYCPILPLFPVILGCYFQHGPDNSGSMAMVMAPPIPQVLTCKINRQEQMCLPQFATVVQQERYLDNTGWAMGLCRVGRCLIYYCHQFELFVRLAKILTV